MGEEEPAGRHRLLDLRERCAVDKVARLHKYAAGAGTGQLVQRLRDIRGAHAAARKRAAGLGAGIGLGKGRASYGVRRAGGGNTGVIRVGGLACRRTPETLAQRRGNGRDACRPRLLA